MKHSLTVIIALFCSAVPAAFGQTPSAKPFTPLEQTVMAAEKGFLEAAKKGDSAFFKRTLADDFSFVGSDGQLGGRQDMIDQFAESAFDLMPYNTKVVTISDSAAIVTYDVVLHVPAAEDQGPPPRYQHFSTVWVKQGDAWKMKFQQTTAAHWGDW